MKGMKGFAVLVMVLAAGMLGACSSGIPQTSKVTASTASSGGTPKNAALVHVTLNEMSFQLDAVPTNAGTITFVVTNEGSIKHDFVLTGNGVNVQTVKLGPGETERLTVELAPGTYNLVCSLPGHSLLGMKGQFTLQ